MNYKIASLNCEMRLLDGEDVVDVYGILVGKVNIQGEFKLVARMNGVYLNYLPGDVAQLECSQCFPTACVLEGGWGVKALGYVVGWDSLPEYQYEGGRLCLQ